jgi:hypothetical protein
VSHEESDLEFAERGSIVIPPTQRAACKPLSVLALNDAMEVVQAHGSLCRAKCTFSKPAVETPANPFLDLADGPSEVDVNLGLGPAGYRQSQVSVSELAEVRQRKLH